MEPLGLNDNLKVTKLIIEEYINGISNKTLVRSEEENQILTNMTDKMKEFYKWDGKDSFVSMAAQNCSDMILYVCKLQLNMYSKENNIFWLKNIA